MFQTFESKSEPGKVADRVAVLRREMHKSRLDAFLVPHADEYQNEYLPPCAERLAWLTGFSGSAGFAIVAARTATLFVDGRYTLQAQDQTDTAVFSIESLIDLPPQKWIASNAQKGWRIGFDPALLTIAQAERFAEKAKALGASLVATKNLVDRIWTDRPQEPTGRISIQKMPQAGERARDKLARLSKAVADAGADFCLLTDPISVAWAFNIRGDDLAHIPVSLLRAVLRAEGDPVIFIEGARLNREADAYLTQLARICEPSELEGVLAELAKGGAKVLCDRDRVSAALGAIVRKAGGKIVSGRDPVVLPRAIKNKVEIAGSRAAHLRDGVAVVRFLAWLDRQKPGSIDEIGAAQRLEALRAETAAAMGSKLLDISFDTISGAGPNGAIVHYRVTEKTNSVLKPNSLYLIDSGAQYRDGTTDITRTVAIGDPYDQAMTDFTLVLKGHIAIATARFPKGTRGVDIDALARIALWRHGMDYAHGTGHGIGSYLSVHEGPQSLSRRGMEPLVPGMILSNEPGFYREGRHGIRIENLLLVHEEQHLSTGNVETMGFETLTLAPIDQRLIDTSLMARDELIWLDSYHSHVLNELAPHLDKRDREWLENACLPLRDT
jgi:Xaa-Pro aminopeptidase